MTVSKPEDGRPGNEPELEVVASALNSGAIHLLRSLAAVDRIAGLTPARLSALSVIVFAGPRSLGSVAGLVAAGLAERRPDPSDGRAVVIAATVAGESLMRAAAGRRIATIASAIADLPAADRRRLAAAADLLDRVATHIRAVGTELG